MYGAIYIAVCFTIWIIAIDIDAAGVVVTNPPQVDGVLTSCGETQLTCSHDNVPEENTRWRVTFMDTTIACLVTVAHADPSPANPYRCGVFIIENVTDLSSASGQLNSTAMVNPLPADLNGSWMECIAGGLSSSPSVDNVTFCVIGKSTCMYVTRTKSTSIST